MATRLATVSVESPGFYGLNTQHQGNGLEPNWALKATNCVFDGAQRIASRKGYSVLTGTPIGGTPDIVQIAEYVQIDGTTEIVSASNNNIYSGTSTLTSKFSTGITANNWQIVNFNNKIYFFQSGHQPLVYNGTTCQQCAEEFTDWAATTAYVLDDIVVPTTYNGYYYVCTTAGTTGGGEPTWDTDATTPGTTADGTVTWTTYKIPECNTVLSAFGRLWAADTASNKTVVYYSDTLIGHKFYGGASGSIDLKTVWTQGVDEITALAEFNNKLIIFGKRSIVIYDGADDPTNMTLADVINGVGCVARDSVQNVGTDILFLSDVGLMSLNRTVVEVNLPLRDVSKNVRDDLLFLMAGETLADMRSVYHSYEGFYLLTLPTWSTVYCFDLKSPAPDGTLRVTTWDSMAPKSFCSARDNTLYIGKEGAIAKYDTFLDDASTYDMTYHSTFMDFDDPTRLKIPKKLIYTMVGGAGYVVSNKWGFDYVPSYDTRQYTVSSGTVYEYNTGTSAEYNIAEFGYGVITSIYQLSPTRCGRVLQIGFDVTINGTEIALQRMDVHVKMGRRI